MLTGSSVPRPSNPHLHSKNPLNSENLALAGYLCVEGQSVPLSCRLVLLAYIHLLGECYGIVIAIGSHTHLGKMIQSNQWPPTPHSLS
jgi:magnesium-transporting ATPase (P-type)